MEDLVAGNEKALHCAKAWTNMTLFIHVDDGIMGHKRRRVLTLKGPGFFVYLKSGGGRIPPPPSDLGRGATKNSEIWHVRRVHQYARADKIAMLKIKPFF